MNVLILNLKKNSVPTLTLCSNIFIYQTDYRRCLVLFKTRVPGYDPIMQRQIRPMTGLERSLYKLNAVRELGDWADEFIDLETEEDDGNDGNGSFYYTSNSSSNGGNKTILNNDDLLQEEEESSIDIDGSTSTDSNIVVPPTMVAQPCVVGDDSSFPSPVIRNRQDSVIVIIR